MGPLPGQGEICLVLALLGLLNQSCKLMKLECEHAPALGGALVSGGWQAAPAIPGCGEFQGHDISRGTSCSSTLYMKARAHLTAPRTQITLSSVHNRSNGGERWREPRLPPSPRVPAREESAEW